MKRHWPEYAIEAAGLGLFMISASAFATLLFHPTSPVVAAVPGGIARRALMGLAMALTAVGLIYNRWGKQSGAHFNPAVTITFWRLGKVSPRDAWAYIGAQIVGGAMGMGVATVVLGRWIDSREVHFVTTLPGSGGAGVAWAAEFVMALLLMSVVLAVSNRPGLARFTGLFAAACVFLFITFEAPLSGMSLNPARTLASALAARDWTAWWVYLTAPPAGMLAAAGLRWCFVGRATVACAKIHHDNRYRCIFCDFHALESEAGAETKVP